MCNFRLQKIYWQEIRKELESINSDFYSLISPLMDFCQETGKDYLYLISARYGEPLIVNGKSELLRIENGKYVYEKDFDTEIFNNFVDECGHTNGHPLSIVKNYNVEISRTQISAYTLDGDKAKKYKFVLNSIKKGEFLGVWETVQMIYNKQNDNVISSWDATAGKTVLLSPLPVPKKNKSNKDYRNLYYDLFKADSTQESFVKIIKETNPDLWIELLVIPEYFYLSQEASIENLRLQKYITSIGWDQENPIRQLAWNDELISDIFGINYYDPFLVMTLKHIDNILNGEAMLLKPISENDIILFNATCYLFEQFHKATYKHKGCNKTCLHYNTPLFFHYDKLTNRSGDWGIEMAHSPSYSAELPALKTSIINEKFDKSILNKLEDYIKKMNYHTEVAYLHRGNDSSNGHVLDFLTRKYNDLYSPILNQYNSKVCLTNMTNAWFLNSLFTFERK